MSGALIAPVFNLGPQFAGQILGLPYDHYRPATANNPTTAGNLLGSVGAWITPDNKGMASTAQGYGKPVWYGWFDPTVTQVGDYLIGPLGTFFIASQFVPEPMQLINCNHTATITAAAPISTFGASTNYGGDIRTTETPIAAGWPCSILQGTKGEVGNAKLPGDVKMPWSSILLPAIPGVIIRNDQIITDENGFRHITSSCELSDLGWRISAMLATT